MPRHLLGFCTPGVEFRQVGGAPFGRNLLDLRDERHQDAFDVAHDRDFDGHVLADLGRVDVHVDDSGVGSEGGDVAGDPVIETHSQGNEQVRRLDRLVGVLPAVHAHD